MHDYPKFHVSSSKTRSTMAEQHPHNNQGHHGHHDKNGSTDQEVPVAYAESTALYDGVYALPLATTNTPSSMVRLTAEQETNLQAHGFPIGLAQELVATVRSNPIRFWTIDNSGSMWTSDGHVLRGKDKNTQLIPCTRWAEMQATVQCHAELAGLLEATTIFHMLNPTGDPRVPQNFSVAEHGADAIPEDINNATMAMLTCQPQGPTPLTDRLIEIREKIVPIASSLAKKGQKAIVVIATDGLPTDAYGGSPEAARDFVNLLRSLQSYPVWLVIRLCTDDFETRTFYNSLDEELELPLEVLDDHAAEAKEVSRHNGWLNYGLPIHRTRELGYQHRLFDLLDERPLNKDEVKEFLGVLFGKSLFENAPDVHTDWRGFIKGVSRVVKNQQYQWNPKSQKMEPWVDVKKLDKMFGERLSLFARMGSSARRSSRKSMAK
ncbi:expressed unknown protein [Seminavis robusta]|uniref:VWFA domain-containing protein n=1 Tax=Seminavis robusta TaxID=568900 RepID=A0A9N8E8K7_9STRA|nr:expressed unknown protein [Seminavis robusta]|eukprot:Sro665_g183890.1 n/a (435) ;mRNA; r:39580-40884